VSVTRVRVGIVSWNTAPLLDRCLAALPAALAGVDAEVRVVDNASSDGSADVAARHGVEVVCNPENVGYAAAMNQALAGDGVDVLVALNPDTEPAPGTLATLVERLLADPDLGLVVPRLVYADGRLQHSVFRFPSPRQAAAVLLVSPHRLRGEHGRRWWADGYHPHDRATDIDWAIGAVHVLRAEALRGDPYDERWFMYVEDVDCCWRLARRGWRRRLEADVEIVHVSNAAGALAWGDERTRRWTIATYDWYLRTFGRSALRRWAAVHSLAVVYLMARTLPRGLRGDPMARGWLGELRRLLPLQVGPMLSGRVPTEGRVGGPPIVARP
jgi:GT2 family glycosyltransferase